VLRFVQDQDQTLLKGELYSLSLSEEGGFLPFLY